MFAVWYGVGFSYLVKNALAICLTIHRKCLVTLHCGDIIIAYFMITCKVHSECPSMSLMFIENDILNPKP